MRIFSLDFASKLIISLFFRVLIVFYGMYIVVSQNDTNIFEWYWYLLGTIVYAVLYYKLIQSKYAKWRLFNDYVFMLFILIGKDIYTFNNVVFILLPFINSPNHTKKEKNVFVLFIYTCGLLFALCWYDEHYRNILINDYQHILVGLLVITFLIWFEYKRSLLLKNVFYVFQNMENNVSTTNGKKHKRLSVHFVFQNIINLYNNEISSKILNKTGGKLVNIVAISFRDDNINIINSSSFIMDIKLDNESIQMLKKGKNESVISDINVILDETEYKNATVIKVSKMYFFLVFDNTKTFKEFLLRFVVSEFFLPIFIKLSNRIYFETRMKIDRKKHMQKLINNLDYITTTSKTLHFLRNKFSPISSYFEMLNDYNKPENEKKQERLALLIDKEKKNAERALVEISQRADYLLDKSNNPFELRNNSKVKYKHIWMLIKDSWKYTYHSELNIITDIDKEIMESNAINTDRTLLEILTTDIIANMRRHSDGDEKVRFYLSETDDMVVEFSNYVNDNRLSTLKLLVRHFNNDDRYEINKRSSHGLSQIKELSTRLDIDVILSLEKNIYKNTLIIKGFKNA